MADERSEGEWQAHVDASPDAVRAAVTVAGFALDTTQGDDAVLVRGEEKLWVGAAANGCAVRYNGPNLVPAHQLTAALATAGPLEVTHAPATGLGDSEAGAVFLASVLEGSTAPDEPPAQGIDAPVVLFTGAASASPSTVEPLAPPGGSGAAPPSAAATPVSPVSRSSPRTGLVLAIAAAGVCVVAVLLVVVVRRASAPSSSLETVTREPARADTTATTSHPTAPTTTQPVTTQLVTTQLPTTQLTTIQLPTTQPMTTQLPTTKVAVAVFPHRVTAHELSVRVRPSVSASEARPDLHTGDTVVIVCQGKGGPIPPDSGADGDPTLWDRLDDGNWVADIYVDTNKPYGRDPNADPWRDPAIPSC